MSLRRRLLRLGAFSGIMTTLLAFTCILIAIASYPAFTWTNNALSDLGVVAGITGPLFNFGLYSSGLFALSFAVFGLYNYIGEFWVGKVGSVTFASTGLALVGIGVFPENFVPIHYLFSVLFFVLLPISLFVITANFAFNRQTKMGLFTLAVAIVAVLTWILYFSVHYVSGVAIPEIASGFAGNLWVVVICCKMLKTASHL